MASLELVRLRALRTGGRSHAGPGHVSPRSFPWLVIGGRCSSIVNRFVAPGAPEFGDRHPRGTLATDPPLWRQPRCPPRGLIWQSRPPARVGMHEASSRERILWTLLTGLAFVRVASGPRRVRPRDDTNPVSDQSRRVTERGVTPEPGAKNDELPLKGGDAERTAETERDRGRAAETPSEVPIKGWKDILGRVYQQISEDRVLSVAAGVTFYALLALFPGITAFVSLYGLFADAGTVSDHLAQLSGSCPPAH